MTVRQRKFAEYYAESGNATQSAIRAGYSERYVHTNASKLLNVEEVKEYIRERTEKEQSKRIMSALERQVLLSDIARNKAESIGARLKAVDILNRMTGAYFTAEDDAQREEVFAALDHVLNQVFDN